MFIIFIYYWDDIHNRVSLTWKFPLYFDFLDVKLRKIRGEVVLLNFTLSNLAVCIVLTADASMEKWVSTPQFTVSSDFESPLVVCGFQRSGTTALASAIASSGCFENFGEVFQTAGNPRLHVSFFKFVQDKNISLASVADYDGAYDVLKGYIEFLYSSANDGVPLVPLFDIKVNYIRALAPFYSYPSEKPFVLQFLQSFPANFLFVWRRDLVDQVLSEEIARQVGVWHDLTMDDIGERTISVDLDAVSQRVKLIVDAENLFADWMPATKRCFHICYEDMFAGDDLNSEVVSFVEERYSFKAVEGMRPRIMKNMGEKSEMIANYDRIRESLLEISSPDHRKLLKIKNL